MSYILLALFSCSLCLAGAFDAFLDGLAKEYFITKSTRGRDLSHHVKVGKISGGAANQDAIATYNPNFNSIGLQEELLVGGNSVRGDIQDSSKVSTIFHEMGHAEMDIYIDNRREMSDAMLADAYKGSLKSFYKKTFPGFSTMALFQEHFGYYRSEIISFIASEIQDVLINNGYNMFTNRCFASSLVKKKKLEGATFEEFQQFFASEFNKDFYRNRIHPGVIFIRGKDVDLMAPQVSKAVINQIHQLFWAYNQDFYNFPINEKDLVTRMNVQSKYKTALAECRKQIWETI